MCCGRIIVPWNQGEGTKKLGRMTKEMADRCLGRACKRGKGKKFFDIIKKKNPLYKWDSLWYNRHMTETEVI